MADVAREALTASIDLLEFALFPGLAPAGRTLLEIWDGLSMVDVRLWTKCIFIPLIVIPQMNRTACLCLTERCADILIFIREEIKDAGDVIDNDPAAPISKYVRLISALHDNHIVVPIVLPCV